VPSSRDWPRESKDTGSGANGGDLDWAAPDAYVKPFSDALQKLKKGEMTETPVQTQFGWHVIRLDDVRDTQFPPLEQVAPQIASQCSSRRRRRSFRQPDKERQGPVDGAFAAGDRRQD